MSYRNGWVTSTVVILLAAGFLSGCEKGQVLAPTDASLTVTASPQTVIFGSAALPDENPTLAGEQHKSVITARILGKDGYPEQGVAITFSSVSGTFDAQKAGVATTTGKTDANSVAQATLWVGASDPTSIDVTALSGGLSQKVTLTKSRGGIAPTDGSLTLTANPATVVLNPTQGQTTGTTALSAQVLDSQGGGVAGVVVGFSSAGGVLAQTSVLTNDKGIAANTLTVSTTDSSSIDVTAQSGTFTKTATVAKKIGGLAPSDGSITLTANPGTIVIDPNQGQSTGTTTLTAKVFDHDGGVLSAIQVLFVASGGVLATTSAYTDDTGTATNTLTLNLNDPDSITVTASSSALSQNATVTKTEVAVNKPPHASISTIPKNQGFAGELVTFDGSSSTDPDGQITCFKWTILSDNPDTGVANPQIFEGSAVSGLDETYNNVQNLSVTLQVSDVAAARTPCDAGGTVPEEYFSPYAYRIQYPIVCNNPPPVANAGPDQTTTGALGQLTTVTLDGRNSTDDLGIDQYIWNCGNGRPADPLVPGDFSQVNCKYFPGTYTATLTVWDKGTGVIDPRTGNYKCRASSDATAKVTINTPQ